MPRFVHIDHCLCDVGGHEFDYAGNVLRAAEAAGFDVVLAANRRFRGATQFPRHWSVYPVFPFTAYTKHCLWFGGHRHLPMGLAGEPIGEPTRGEHSSSLLRKLTARVTRVIYLPRELHRHRLIRRFAAACERLFKQIRLNPEDHVFLATVTEFDLLGLTRYLADNAVAQVAKWHLQFHFGLYGNCPSAAAARSERWRAVRRQFEFVLERLPHESVHFYNTTEELAAQYNDLNVAQFRHMAYAVSPSLETTAVPSDGPLRLTCAGAMRRDKKTRELRRVAQALRSDSFFDRKIQIVAQVPSRKRRRLGIPERAAADDRSNVPFLPHPHPLERADYYELIRRTDIGLFLHDNRRYSAQCSGVLHEMLAAGKPVLVPGGCWLANQIAEPIFTHIEGLCATLPSLGRQSGNDLQWRRPPDDSLRHPGWDVLSLAESEWIETRFPIPTAATNLVVEFRWSDGSTLDQFLDLQLNQTVLGKPVGQAMNCIIGQRHGGGVALAVFHLYPGADQVILRLGNVQNSGSVTVSDLQTQFLQACRHFGRPAGSVGLIAARPNQAAQLLRDMLTHYPHYRESAAAFSHTWRERHHPSHTIALLTGRSSGGGRCDEVADGDSPQDLLSRGAGLGDGSLNRRMPGQQPCEFDRQTGPDSRSVRA